MFVSEQVMSFRAENDRYYKYCLYESTSRRLLYADVVTQKEYVYILNLPFGMLETYTYNSTIGGRNVRREQGHWV